MYYIYIKYKYILGFIYIIILDLFSINIYIYIYIYIYISAVKYQISNLFFSVRFKSLIFGYLERFDVLKSLF